MRWRAGDPRPSIERDGGPRTGSKDYSVQYGLRRLGDNGIFKLGAGAVVTASAIAADKAAIVIRLRIGTRCLGASSKHGSVDATVLVRR